LDGSMGPFPINSIRNFIFHGQGLAEFKTKSFENDR